MLFLLSPAKSLDYDTPVGDVPHTLPQFVPQAAELIGTTLTWQLQGTVLTVRARRSVHLIFTPAV